MLPFTPRSDLFPAQMFYLLGTLHCVFHAPPPLAVLKYGRIGKAFGRHFPFLQDGASKCYREMFDTREFDLLPFR